MEVGFSDPAQFLQRVSINRKTLETAKKQYRDRLAPGFSPFQFINQDELGFSRVIGWLLDPNASHGQGARFLELFLEANGIHWTKSECEYADVRLEVPVGREGRIDILVDSGRRSFAIENKPFAGDQDQQLNRYFRYFDQRKLDQSWIIYLTSHGFEPTAFSLGEADRAALVQDGRLILSSYVEHIANWVEECRAVSRADRVAVFLDQLRQAIAKKFEGVSDMSDQSQLVDMMLESKEAIISAFDVSNAKSAMQERLLAKLQKELEALCQAEGWSVDWNVNSKAGSGVNVDFSQNCKVVFRLEFFRGNLDSVNYGVKAKDYKSITDEQVISIQRALTEGLGRNRDGKKLWPWWGQGEADDFLPMVVDWSTSSKPWISIKDGSFSESFISVAKRVQDAFKRANLT